MKHSLMILALFAGTALSLAGGHERVDTQIEGFDKVAFSKRSAFMEAAAEPRWFTHNYLLSDAEENYKFKQNAAIKPAYRDTSSAWSLNEEWLSFYGEDSTGVNKRIAPRNDLSAPANDTDNANGTLDVSFVGNGYLPGSCEVWNDSRTCDDLYPDIDTDYNQTVTYGRVLYRSGPLQNGAEWGAWNVAYYSANTELHFSGNQALQFVVIYEIKEPGINIFQQDRYYHVRGVYRIDVYANS